MECKRTDAAVMNTDKAKVWESMEERKTTKVLEKKLSSWTIAKQEIAELQKIAFSKEDKKLAHLFKKHYSNKAWKC